MAHSYNCLLFCFIVLFIIPPTTSISNTSSKPKALALLVSKDESTLQYLTQIKQRTPLVPVKLTLDLGGQFLWVDCDQGYVSSSYKHARCGSAQCKLARSKSCIDEYSCTPGPGCNNHTCTRFPANSISRASTNRGELATDVVSIQSVDIDGKINPPGPFVSVPNLIFSCGPTFLLDGLASGVKGMAGLGRTQVSLPSQFSAAFNFDRKFSICLSSSTASNGAVFFGDVTFPNIDVSKSLIYTPLILNPVHNEGLAFKGDPSTDYFIEVKSILIGGNVVPLNTSLLSINKQGNGGTKVSTADPFTVLETSIYKAFIETFSKALLVNIPRVKPVAPFGACFNSSFNGGTAAPEIHLVLPGNNRVWKIYGANSMVRVGKDAMCLAFVDGGVNPRTSIVIGGYQLEDNLLEFDLTKSRLGFSSSLLSWQITCSKLTSNV